MDYMFYVKSLWQYTVYDCGEMIKEAEKANKRLFVVKQNRYNPPVRAIKEALDENRLGKI